MGTIFVQDKHGNFLNIGEAASFEEAQKKYPAIQWLTSPVTGNTTTEEAAKLLFDVTKVRK